MCHGVEADSDGAGAVEVSPDASEPSASGCASGVGAEDSSGSGRVGASGSTASGLGSAAGVTDCSGAASPAGWGSDGAGTGSGFGIGVGTRSASASVAAAGEVPRVVAVMLDAVDHTVPSSPSRYPRMLRV